MSGISWSVIYLVLNYVPHAVLSILGTLNHEFLTAALRGGSWSWPHSSDKERCGGVNQAKTAQLWNALRGAPQAEQPNSRANQLPPSFLPLCWDHSFSTLLVLSICHAFPSKPHFLRACRHYPSPASSLGLVLWKYTDTCQTT